MVALQTKQDKLAYMFWRTPIRLIGLSRHTSTYLNWLLRSAKAERSKRATSMPLEPIRKDRSALAERKMYLHTARATPCGDGWAKHLRQFGGVARALAFGLIDLRCLFLRGVNLCCRPPSRLRQDGGRQHTNSCYYSASLPIGEGAMLWCTILAIRAVLGHRVFCFVAVFVGRPRKIGFRLHLTSR